MVAPRRGPDQVQQRQHRPSDAYVAIFGGALHPSFVPAGVEVNPTDTTTRGRALYIVNVETGATLYKATQGKNDAGDTKLFAPMPAPPAVADVDDDGYLDVAYIGDLNGRMWRVDLSQPVCPSCGTPTPVPFLLYDAITVSPVTVQPIFYDAGIIFVSGGAPPTLGVAFGTGNRADLVSGNGTQTNRFILVYDIGGTTTFHATDLVNLPPGCTTPCGPGTPTSSGYFLDFEHHDEKAVSTVFSTLGNLAVLTSKPQQRANPCDPKGGILPLQFLFRDRRAPTRQSSRAPMRDFKQDLGAGWPMRPRQASNGDIIDWALMQGGDVNMQTSRRA